MSARGERDLDWQLGITVGLLVYMAFVLDLFGFLARDELWLRLLMLAASALYLVYYYYVADDPLWDAIITNALLAAANLLMIVVVVLERTTFSMSKETVALYRAFPMLSPGQFRRILKAARDVHAPARKELTRAGTAVANLYYVVDGPFGIQKGAQAVRVDGGAFIGEIAFLTGAPASATVSVEPGTRYLEWEADALHRLIRKSPKLRLALSAQFNDDLVRKVANSMPGLGV